jgi:hypothetical protein
MHLRIDGAGQDQRFAQVVALARGGGRSLADGGDPAAGNRHMTALDDAIGEHQGADKDSIEIGHGSLRKAGIRLDHLTVQLNGETI